MNDDAIDRYVREVDAFLRVDRGRRERVLEEIESHLRDRSVVACDGAASAEEATTSVLAEFGPPQLVAAGFNDEVAPSRAYDGTRRWLPLMLPLVLLLLACSALLVSSVLWWPDGLSAGQRRAQLAYLRSGLIAAVVTGAAYLAIRRADHDHTWRIAAWACTPFTLVLFFT